MATSPRSPKSPGKFNYEKEDSSFWEKLGTLGRKKKIKEGEWSEKTKKHEFLPNMDEILFINFDSRSM